RGMDVAMGAADLVVCRSGGSTVAELAIVGVGALLVPLPIATEDHQTVNARSLADVGAAVVIPDGELTADRLVAEVDRLMADAGALEQMAKAAHGLARPDAADRIAALVEEYAGE